MDDEYDFIVLGTGLKECILSGLLSVGGHKILHMDRNSYYGGESASLNLEQLYEKFKKDQKPPEEFGRSRNYNVDICPKFIMACGDLVKMLLHTGVTRYLDFRSISGSYVVKEEKLHKVPSTPVEAMSSGLMGMFQKRHFRSYLQYVEQFEEADEKTWQGMDPKTVTNRQLFKHFSCDENTQAFTGHAMALYLDDSYLDMPALECIRRVKLYAYSMSRYGKSPYIYPLWGLGGLPEGFSRLCAIHGGVYMLNKPVEEIVYDAAGRVIGVKSEGETARCKKGVLADPSYFAGTNKIKPTGQVARCICILDHAVAGILEPNDSAQIIIPALQTGRNSDIYISIVNWEHKVAQDGKYVAVIQLFVETEKPQLEMDPALRLLGKRDATFFWVSTTYGAVNDWKADGCFITSSYDATSHFETETEEVAKIYEMMTGKKVDLTASAEPDELQQGQ